MRHQSPHLPSDVACCTSSRSSFEELPQLLVPWDEDLVASHNIHFFVAHDPIFDAVESLAHALHGQIDMVTAAIPLVDREHTTLFVHRIPHLRILELLSNQILRGQQLEARVQDLEDPWFDICVNI